MPPWILVTPSSRGLGLALSRRLLRTTPLPLIATARTDLEATRAAILSRTVEDGEDDLDMEVADESRLRVLELDVTDETRIASAASTCSSLFPRRDSHLHLALTLAGILHPEKSPSQLEHAQLTATFATNVIGPLLLMKHFSPFLPSKTTSTPLLPTSLHSPSHPHPHTLNTTHATWASLSARVGSITDNHLGGWYSYRSSKAALNQSIKTFDNYLKTKSGDKAVAVGLHPGTVKTGLSREFWGGVKEGKLFSAGFSAGRLVEVLRGMEGEGRGRCWDWSGEEVMP